MALTLDAIVRVAAKVYGTERIGDLTKALSRVEQGSRSLGKESSKLTFGLGALQGQLAGLLSAGALVGFGTAIYKVGNEMLMLERRLNTVAGPFKEVQQLQDFAGESAKRFGMGIKSATEQVVDIYSRLKPMGASLEDIKTTFTGFTIATQRAGLGVRDMNEALRQFGQAVGSGRLQGDELRSLLERIPGLADNIAKAYNRVAESKGIELITRDRANKLIEEVKRGETRQTEILREQYERRKRLLRQETADALREIARRYAKIEQTLNDNFDDQAYKEEERQRDLADQRTELLNDQSEAEIKAIRRRYEDIRRETFANQESMSDAQRVQIERNLQDREEMEIKAIQDRTESILEQERKNSELLRREYSRRQRDLLQERMNALEDQRAKEEARVNDISSGVMRQLDAINKAELEKIKKNSKDQQEEIKKSIRATAGDVKQLGEEGRLTTDVLTMLGKILAELKAPDPTPLNRFMASLENIMVVIGKQLTPFINQGLPELEKLLQNLVVILRLFGPILQGIAVAIYVAIKAFNDFFDLLRKLPPEVKETIKIIGEIAAGFLFVFGVVGPLLKAIGGFIDGLPLIGAGLAGIIRALGSLAPLITGVRIAFSFFMGWITSVLLPFLGSMGSAILAFFSGPAGWITLVVVALAGLAYVFREPIGKALNALKEETGKLFTSLKNSFSSGWNTIKADTPRLIAFLLEDAKKIYEGMVKVWNNLKDSTKKIFTDIYEGIRKTINKILKMVYDFIQSMVRSFSNFSLNVEFFTNAGRSLNARNTQQPDATPPQLASGGYASGRSLVEIAEAGQGEYAIPEDRMARAAINYMQGARGVDVLNRRPSSMGGMRSDPPQINLNIKPNVISRPDGNFVTLEEAIAIAQNVAAQTAGQLMHPEARLAYGLS